MRTLFIALTVSAIGLYYGHPSSAADDLSVLLEKAVAAHGGADSLQKHDGKAVHSKSRGTIHEKEMIPFVEEVFLQPPGKSKKVTEMEIQGQKTVFMMVSNGEKHWLKFGNEVRVANAAEQAGYKEARNHGEVLGLLKLKQRLGDITRLPETEVNGRSALGIEVQTEGHREMQLYFDQESGFLVKTRTWKKYPQTGQTFVEDKIMSDYQDTDGYKWPRHVVAYRDGKKFLTKEVTHFELPETLDDKLFVKP